MYLKLNIFSNVLFLILFAFASIQSALGLVIPVTIGISNSPTSAVAGANDPPPPTAAGNQKSIFYFNLTQLAGGANFNQSTLRLFLPRAPQSGSSISVYKIRGVWNEQSFVFMPQIDFTPVITVPAEQIAAARVLEIDVTSVIKDWSTAPTGIEGFLVLGKFGESGPNTVPLNFDGASSFGLSASLVVDEQAGSQSAEADPFNQWPASLRSRLVNPVFSVQPKILATGSISGIAHASGGISYQWFNNGVPIPNSNSASLSLEGLSSGNYTLRATNGFTSITSFPVSFDAANYIPNFSLIPAGTFQMGDNLDGNPDSPVHNVYVSQFFMAQTELTYGEWRNVKQWADAHGYQFDNAGAGNGDNYPVTNVNWYDAFKWCNAKSEMEGLTPCYYTSGSQTEATVYRIGNVDMTTDMVDWGANGYRLPTEAEWEKSARGGAVGKRYSLGDAVQPDEANFNRLTGTSISVGSYSPNGYGLCDTTGNVWEMCWDFFDWGFSNNSDPRGASQGDKRIARGGAYNCVGDFLHVSFRGRNAPTESYNVLGFRLARTSKALNPRDITSGLVAYYPFNGNANDTSGNGFGGTVVGAALANDRFGNSNRCFEFNGSDNYIETSAQFPSGNTPKSFSFWFNPSMLKRGWMLSGGLDYDGQAFGAFFESANGSLVFHGNGGNADLALGNLTLTDKWSHIAVTYDGLNLRGYINGLLTAQREVALQTSLSNIKIGCRQNPLGEALGDAFFKGKLDDVRIYNRALTAKEVAALYNSEAPVQITAQPAIYPDGTLLAKAEGGEVSYQWFKNGIPISGGTSASLPLAAGSLASGTYTLRASNRQSSVTSGSLQYSATTNPNFHEVVQVAGTNLAFSRYETTVGQWKRFVAETGWNKSDGWKNPANEGQSDFVQNDSHPVVKVSWLDAKDYCAWLSEKTGKIWRLPTEQEWITLVPITYPWGNNFPPSAADGNFAMNTDGSYDWPRGGTDGFKWTAPVGSFNPNSIGLYDLGGNVWEWIDDSSVNGDGMLRSIRGSSWNEAGDSLDGVASAHRVALISSFQNNNVGFRVVCELPPDITTGLGAYYPFNGNANDASGNGYDGIVHNAKLARDRFGNEDKAFEFDGINDFIDLGNRTVFNFNSSNFSISVWVKSSAPKVGTYFIAKYSIGAPNCYGLGTDESGNSYAFGGEIDTRGHTSLGDNHWHSVVAIYNINSRLDVYLDGQLETFSDFSGHSGTMSNSFPLLIGKISSGQNFAGWVDDVRIYNRALTAKEVAALYNSEAPPLPNPFVGSSLVNGLSAYYSFDGTLRNSVKPEDSAVLHGGSLVNEVFLNGEYIEYPTPLTTGTHTFSTSINVFETGVTNTDGESYISIGSGANNVSLLRHTNVGGSSVSGGPGTDMILSDFCSGSIIALASGETLQGSWVNYTTTANETFIKFYKNGVLVKSANLSPEINYDALGQHWFTGMHSWDSGNQSSQRLIGRFDDFTVWSRTLSDSEVFNSYNFLKK